jgi:hypothetical protein
VEKGDMKAYRIEPGCRLALKRFDPDDTGAYKKNEDGRRRPRRRRTNSLRHSINCRSVSMPTARAPC